MENKTVKVLLVEDDLNYAQLVQRILSKAQDAIFDVEWTDCLANALDRLTQGDIDVVLLDLTLPDSSGFDTFVRVNLQAPDAAVLVLTGTDDENLALKAVQIGAQDYLVKGEVNGKHLVRSILYGIKRHGVQKKEQPETSNPVETHFSNIIERNADGIIVLNKEGSVLCVNPAAELLFGRKEEELVGEIFGFPIVTDKNTQINLFNKSGETIVVEMRVVNIEWKGETACLASLRDITDHKKTEETLRNLSISDDLTGLLNRRGFLSLADRYLKSIQGKERSFLVAFFDLDGLKQINDTFGHNEGSQAIMETAEILRETFRTSDVLSRFGGDEFVVLAKDISEDGEEIILERLQNNIEAHNAKTKHPYKLSISMGIECYDPQNPTSIDELLRNADQSMYSNKQGKKSGGSQRVFL